MLIYLFSVILGVLPSFGRGEVIELGFWTTGFLTTSGLKALKQVKKISGRTKIAGVTILTSLDIKDLRGMGHKRSLK